VVLIDCFQEAFGGPGESQTSAHAPAAGELPPRGGLGWAQQPAHEILTIQLIVHLGICHQRALLTVANRGVGHTLESMILRRNSYSLWRRAAWRAMRFTSGR